MPIYVYKFVDTGETIEVEQAFTDDTLTEYPHPDDGEPRPVKKVFLPVGVTFKGSGFYKTDSRSSKSSSAKSNGANSDDTSKSSQADQKPSGSSSDNAAKSSTSSSSDSKSSSSPTSDN